MQISAVGVGTAPIGSGRDWPVWWGPQDEAESIRMIHTALDVGVNWIDTAPFYGWGRGPRLPQVRDAAGREAGRPDGSLACRDARRRRGEPAAPAARTDRPPAAARRRRHHVDR